MNYLLSVIVPAHNEKRTICKTVDSLLRQDYSCFEIIVVDDGSDDDTDEDLIDCFGLNQIGILQKQCQLKHKPIVKIWDGICNNVHLYLIQKENGGKGDALNAGVDFCHGDYFACIDADCIFSSDTLSDLTKTLYNDENVVAVGGRVLPQTGLSDFFLQKGFLMRKVLQGYQELEYGIAFCIVRPIFDKLGTTMLISGALGLYNKDVVIRLGGYAVNTVGEDMELVMRIRRFAAESDDPLEIRYTKKALCFTELPWNEKDLRKQRIRWTVGLTDVLWKYREMATHKKYTFLEKLTFWYYVLFEKFSPHIEFASLIISIVLSAVWGISQTVIVLMAITVSLQVLLSISGSFKSIKDSVKLSENKFSSILKFLFLMATFVSVYHLWHSFCRLIAVPSFQRKRRKTNNHGPSWVSPTRM